MLSIPKRILKGAIGRGFEWVMPLARTYEGMTIILMYHRVLDRRTEYFGEDSIMVTPPTFEMHLQQLREIFDIVPLVEAIHPKDGKRRCVITFDDGWLDTYETAYPILRKYEIPATVFLPVALMGSSNCFWFESVFDLARKMGAESKERAFIEYFRERIPSWRPANIERKGVSSLVVQMKKLPGPEIDDLIAQAYNWLKVGRPSRRYVMNWSEVTEMGLNGMTFGSHGLNHYILTSVDYSVKQKEIGTSFKILKEMRIPGVSSVFSYPNGNWDDECLDLVQEAGYLGAVTTGLGCNGAGTSRFRLKRVLLHEEISNTPSLFWFRIFQSFVAGAGPYVQG
ncbi:MAG: polysaccharide deacetylase family protein [Deltaproteobacteria bacterium]